MARRTEGMEWRPDPREEELAARESDHAGEEWCEACGRWMPEAARDACVACGDEPAA